VQNRISTHIRSNIVGYIALFLFAMGGSAYALDGPLPGQNQVGSDDIINGEVKTADIGTGEVKNGDIGAFEINANNIAPDSLGGTKIADRQVKNADLGLGASSSNTIRDGGIEAIDVKANTLTGAQIDELSLDPTLLQRRITDTCAVGQAIRAVAQNGTVTCETVGGGGGASWLLAGNSGTTSSDFLGTTDNNPLNLRVNNARGLRLEPASDGTNESPNVIGGIADNSVTSGVHSAVIGGGGRGTPSDPTSANRVTDHQGVVGGGANNQAGDDAGTVGDATLATVAGGGNNKATGEAATVGGGFFDHATGSRATVSGGDNNTASGHAATVGGGAGNTASGTGATVSGGETSQATGLGSMVPGGFSNTAQGDFSAAFGLGAQANHNGAFVWADSNNAFFPSTAQDQFSVRSTGGARLVSGIDGTGSPISGLELPAGGSGWSTLVNGRPFDISVNGARGFRIDPASDGSNPSPNVIGGSPDNSVTPGVDSATIAGGGRANKVTDNFGVVGGGAFNRAGDDAGTVDDQNFATVAGGTGNIASGFTATVGGGNLNTAGGLGSTVGGGVNNSSTATGFRATVGGGGGNTASSFFATVGGGESNVASGNHASILGGGSNTASGLLATVVGGNSNSATAARSLAAGTQAKANHDGSFVWADSNFFDFASTANNQFSVRATGGARFVSGIDGSGNPNAGVQLASGAGSWSSLSDRASKRAIEPVSGRGVLRELASIPVSTWSYRAQDRSIRHIGPMAQDFYRAFGVGEDRRHISSVDADGVAMAAIKGLNRKVERLQRKVASLKRGGSR
jgi:trimeric autotransporter adhesin